MISSKLMIGQLFEQFDWLRENKTLKQFKSVEISVPITSNRRSDLSNFIDADSALNSVLSNEFNHYVTKMIVSSLFDTIKFDWIDNRGHKTSYIEQLKDTSLRICNSGYQNFISDPETCSELQDLEAFDYHKSEIYLNNITYIYSSGLLNDVKCWVNANMKFGDRRICLFNGVEINIENMITDISDSSPKIVMKFDIDIKVSDSKLIFIIDNEKSEAYKHYQSLNRDIKINDVLK